MVVGGWLCDGKGRSGSADGVGWHGWSWKGSHGSSIWRVVWVVVVEIGMAAMEGGHGLSMKAPNC